MHATPAEVFLDFEIPEKASGKIQIPIYDRKTRNFIGTAKFGEDGSVRLYVKPEIELRITAASIEDIGKRLKQKGHESYSLGTVNFEDEEKDNFKVYII